MHFIIAQQWYHWSHLVIQVEIGIPHIAQYLGSLQPYSYLRWRVLPYDRWPSKAMLGHLSWTADAMKTLLLILRVLSCGEELSDSLCPVWSDWKCTSQPRCCSCSRLNSIWKVLFNGDFVHIELKKATLNVQQNIWNKTQIPSLSFFSKPYIMESLLK